MIGLSDVFFTWTQSFIETEWNNRLHKPLAAEEHAAQAAWRNSPEA
jgi:hypothetical protein